MTVTISRPVSYIFKNNLVPGDEFYNRYKNQDYFIVCAESKYGAFDIYRARYKRYADEPVGTTNDLIERRPW